MRFLLSVLAIISSTCAFDSPVYRQEEWNNREPKTELQNQFYEGIFRTRIDHFNPLNQDVSDFVYYVNANFFETGNPLYIHIKDAYDLSHQWIERGLMVDIAEETGAALLNFDMRFFGRNRIRSDLSFENLELLTFPQMLADIATFIRFIREYVGGSQFSKIILWGSGWGGTLAVWARKRYPHLVTASYSSSGFFEPNYYSFMPFDLLESTLMPTIGDRDCSNRLQAAYQTIYELIENGEGEYISNLFHYCYPIDTDDPKDIASFHERSIKTLMIYIETYHNNGVQDFCFNMRAIPDEPLLSLARWKVHVYGHESCTDISYREQVERSRNIEWDQIGTDSGRRQWYFLQCTQYGAFPLATPYTWIPIDLPLAYHLKKCEDILGPQYNSSILATAIENLYLEFEEPIANVIYTNGNIDPWRFYGRQFDERGVTINIDYHSKSADLPSLSINDPESLYHAKQNIRDLILQWSRDENVQS